MPPGRRGSTTLENHVGGLRAARPTCTTKSSIFIYMLSGSSFMSYLSGLACAVLLLDLWQFHGLRSPHLVSFGVVDTNEAEPTTPHPPHV